MDIALVARSDMDPCPRVQVTVSDIPVGATVTVQRTYDGASVFVRGVPNDEIVTGAFVVTDYELPLQESVTYTAVSSTGVSSTADTYVWSPAGFWDTVIMQDPLAPKTARAAALTEYALENIVIPRGGELLRPVGARLPVSVGGMAHAAAQMPLQWYVESEQHRRDFEPLLDAPVLLVRSIDRVPLPRLAYVELGGIQIDREKYISEEHSRSWTYTASASLVRPPSAAIAAYVYTWADWQQQAQGLTWSDWQALMAGKTWLDFARNPEPPNA